MLTAEKLIREIISKVPSCNISISKNEKSVNGLEYVLRGFYKSGEIRLVMVNDSVDEDESQNLFVAYGRYGDETDIYRFSDLVELNVDWFIRSCKSTWKQMDPEWEEHALKLGFIERKEVISYTYKRPGDRKWR